MNITQTENRSHSTSTADQVAINYYTDPLCCWSWAMEQHWDKLLNTYRQQIAVKYVMGGMIRDWQHYDDPLNIVSRPFQMGPVWMHASNVSGVAMNYHVWHQDPPASSWPACVAVKCASLQSAEAEHVFLKDIRKAIMVEGLNVSKEHVLFDVAEKIAIENPGVLNNAQFVLDWNSGKAIEAFNHDIQLVQYHKIGRFPTLTMTRPGKKGIIITGYRPYETLENALNEMF